MHTRFDLLKPNQETHITEKQSQQKADHDQSARSRQFQVGQSVMAKNLRPGPKWVSGVIVQSLGPLSFLIKMRDGQTWRRHVDHLKKLQTTNPETENGDENSDSDADSWELVHSPTLQKTQSQEMLQGMALNLIRQTNCLTPLRMRLTKLRPLQELALDAIHPELIILLIISH